MSQVYTIPRTKTKTVLTGIRVAFYRLITTLCFIIFPSKISSLFANLTIMSLIYDLKGIKLEDKIINNKSIHQLFDTYINENVLIFPRATVWIFWSNKTLDRQINLDGNRLTIGEAIKDKEMFERYKRRIIDYLIRDLPGIVKFKLGLNDRTMAVLFRNNIIQALSLI